MVSLNSDIFINTGEILNKLNLRELFKFKHSIDIIHKIEEIIDKFEINSNDENAKINLFPFYRNAINKFYNYGMIETHKKFILEEISIQIRRSFLLNGQKENSLHTYSLEYIYNEQSYFNGFVDDLETIKKLYDLTIEEIIPILIISTQSKISKKHSFYKKNDLSIKITSYIIHTRDRIVDNQDKIFTDYTVKNIPRLNASLPCTIELFELFRKIGVPKNDFIIDTYEGRFNLFRNKEESLQEVQKLKLEGNERKKYLDKCKYIDEINKNRDKRYLINKLVINKESFKQNLPKLLYTSLIRYYKILMEEKIIISYNEEEDYFLFKTENIINFNNKIQEGIKLDIGIELYYSKELFEIYKQINDQEIIVKFSSIGKLLKNQIELKEVNNIETINYKFKSKENFNKNIEPILIKNYSLSWGNFFNINNLKTNYPFHDLVFDSEWKEREIPKETKMTHAPFGKLIIYNKGIEKYLKFRKYIYCFTRENLMNLTFNFRSEPFHFNLLAIEYKNYFLKSSGLLAKIKPRIFKEEFDGTRGNIDIESSIINSAQSGRLIPMQVYEEQFEDDPIYIYLIIDVSGSMRFVIGSVYFLTNVILSIFENKIRKVVLGFISEKGEMLFSLTNHKDKEKHIIQTHNKYLKEKENLERRIERKKEEIKFYEEELKILVLKENKIKNSIEYNEKKNIKNRIEILTEKINLIKFTMPSINNIRQLTESQFYKEYDKREMNLLIHELYNSFEYSKTTTYVLEDLAKHRNLSKKGLKYFIVLTDADVDTNTNERFFNPLTKNMEKVGGTTSLVYWLDIIKSRKDTRISLIWITNPYVNKESILHLMDRDVSEMQVKEELSKFSDILDKNKYFTILDEINYRYRIKEIPKSKYLSEKKILEEKQIIKNGKNELNIILASKFYIWVLKNIKCVEFTSSLRIILIGEMESILKNLKNQKFFI